MRFILYTVCKTLRLSVFNKELFDWLIDWLIEEIFGDQFVTKSLLRPTMKEFWKSIIICQSYRQKSGGLFLTHGVTYISTETLELAALGVQEKRLRGPYCACTLSLVKAG